MSDALVLSPYQSNVAPIILEKQRMVFDHLGIPIKQVNIDGIEHGTWMEQTARECTDDVIVFCDIDAFPVTKAAYLKIVGQARAGHLSGVAHVANHFDPDHIYAGPMFMAIETKTYDALGGEGFARKDGNDAGQYLTRAAEAADIPVNLHFPSTVIAPLWAMSDRAVYGIGTFYADNGIFHLFQARFAENIELFVRVADDVVKGRLDFATYLDMRTPPKTAPPVKSFLKSVERKLRPILKAAQRRS